MSDAAKTTASTDYQRGFRDGLEEARQIVIGHQRPDGGDLELGAKNRVLKRVANKIWKARKETVVDHE